VKTTYFLKEKFREYYAQSESSIFSLNKFKSREFAFAFFDAKTFIRHKSMRDERELSNFLASNAPSDVYYSAAYYEVPDIPDMSKKNWLGCDLIFDIDADHIPTSCKEKHDKWVCRKCGESQLGTHPAKCPKCKSSEFTTITWICEECLEAAKEEILKIIEDFLIPDFGFNSEEIQVYFSGNRGYHIHIESENILKLDSSARREIVDYIKGTSVDPKLHGVTTTRIRGGEIIIGPKLSDVGWKGRIARGVLKFLENLDETQLNSIKDIPTRKRNIILKERDKIIKGLLRQIRVEGASGVSWDVVKGLDLNVWIKLARKAALTMGGNVDEPVTADTHRLIRLPGSLNGKTGFLVKKIELNDIQNFDPFKDAIVFTGHVTVYVNEANEFRIGDEVYGPFSKETVELPTAAAVFLMCKGLASLPE